jgi:DNA-binding transcriptional MerR regulator
MNSASPAGLSRIGQAAETVGLSLRTVRYYEEVGLLTPTGRSPGGFRLYNDEQIERLRILKAMKPFGLTLEEIRDLMELFDRTRDEVPAEAEIFADRLDAFGRRAEERAVKLESHAAQVRRLGDRIAERSAALRKQPGIVRGPTRSR